MPGTFQRMPPTPAERFSIEPPPEWVHQPDIQELIAKNSGNGSINVHYSQQYDLESRGMHIRNVYRVDSIEEVKMGSNIEFDLDPVRDRLAVHHVCIVRSGSQVIECAKAEEVRFIQPEEARHSLVFDGRYLAIVLMDDVRPGDIIDVSSTTYNVDPILPGSHFGSILACAPAGVDHFRASLRTMLEGMGGEGDEVEVRVFGEELQFAEERAPDGRKILVIEDFGQKPRRFSFLAPGWFRQLPSLSWSSMGDWKRVSASVATLWKENMSGTGTEDSVRQCLAELEIQPGSGSDPAQVDAVIRFVQDDIRYLSLSEGIGSHVPRPPSVVLAKRYGDCKDKSILLALLLRQMGIRAWPALVHTEMRHKAKESLPSPNSFNHAIVCMEWDGETFWIDPTLSSQGGTLRSRVVPPFGCALVVREEGGDLAEIPLPDPSKSAVETVENILLEKDKLSIEIETLAKGSEADMIRMARNQQGRERYVEGLKAFASRIYPNAEFSAPMQWEDDRENNRIRITEHYTADAVPEKSALNRKMEFYPVMPLTISTRMVSLEKGELPASPIALPHPMNLSHEIRFRHNLPEVSWKRQKEAITGPGFRYDFTTFTKRKLVTFQFQYRTDCESIGQDEADLYRSKTFEVFESMGRGVPVKKSQLWLWLIFIGFVLAGQFFQHCSRLVSADQ